MGTLVFAPRSTSLRLLEYSTCRIMEMIKGLVCMAWLVYPTGTVTWRISKAAREVFDTHRYDSAFINGSLHWFAKSDLGNLTCTSILKPSSLDHSRCLLLMLVGVVCGS